MVEVVPSIILVDLCDPAPQFQLIFISTDEAESTNTFYPGTDEAAGDGNTKNDVQIDGDGRIFLRAERAGSGDGRTYTLTYEATDAMGNSTIESVVVKVPHNR